MYNRVLLSPFGFRAALAVGGLAASLCFAAPAHAQLVNGSFEQGNFTGVNPQGAAHSTQLVAGSTNITGWTVENEIAWIEPGNPYGITASDGMRVLDLTGYHDSQPEGSIQQTLALVVGNSYTLGLDLGYNPNLATSPDGVTVTIAEAGVSQTFNNDNTGTGTTFGNNFYKHFTFSFKATQTTNTLLLQGSAASSGADIGLDNITLVNTTPAVTPEPGSMALLVGMGVTGAGFLARRRKQAR